MKKLQLLFAGMFSLAVMISCGGSDSAPTDESTASATTSTDAAVGDYDPTRGLGKWDETNVEVSSFDPAVAAEGKEISEVKCTSCDKITDERLGGPGWVGVTERHRPYWIMNLSTDADAVVV